jgi:hypothetical protein
LTRNFAAGRPATRGFSLHFAAASAMFHMTTQARLFARSRFVMHSTRVSQWLLIAALCLAGVAENPCPAQESKPTPAAAFRQGQPVAPVSKRTLICEAEEFLVAPGKSAWLARPFGTNYYAATFANSFLSRKGYLGAPEQCEPSVATISVNVPKAGKYLALVRYEACYRFETQFRLQVEQQGQKKLDRLYGALDNVKIWAFREKLKKQVAWSWGAGENVVWEGHDAFVDLAAGPAKLTLIAGKQPEPAARRNVDLVMLTSDVKQVQDRIDKENYLPLDGMLTQAGDVFLKVHNKGGELKLTVPNGTEHSPYWVHIRNWKPIVLAVKPAETTDWVEVGSLLDTLSDGQWTLSAAGKGLAFDLEFGVRDAAGKIASIRKFANQTGDVTLAYDADTRYTRRIRLADDVLYDLVDYLKKRPVQGVAPKRTLIYGTTFAPKPANAKYTAAVDEFTKLMGATAFNVEGASERNGLIRGYIDVRGVPTNKLEEYCKKLPAPNKIAVVSLGDEIGLETPPAKDVKPYHDFLKSKDLKPADVDPAAGADWSKVAFDPSPKLADTNPGVFYWSKIYSYRHGIKQLKERTDILKKNLPNAGIGANFSPHHGAMYLGSTHMYISLFREGGMTMPWSEDYIWQVPVGSPQMNSIVLDMFRCGIKGQKGMKIQQYVMPHTPNNTTNTWRRLFYATLGHGAKIINLFEFRPVQAAYTENHCSDPAMYQEVRRSLHELGTFEDIIQDGEVMPAKSAIFCSETADVWDNNRAPFGAAKRCLYWMIRGGEPLDFVVEGDGLGAYEVLYLCDANVSRSASRAIADWVKAGGKLVVMAGGGMFDEYNRPNKVLREVLGIEQIRLEESKEVIQFEKQDLPFAQPIAVAKLFKFLGAELEVPAFGARSLIKLTTAKKELEFKDGQPAGTMNKMGKGQAAFFAMPLALSAMQRLMPKRPVDRGATDDSMAHFLPRAEWNEPFWVDARHVPVICSSPVETTVVQAKQGAVVALINWRPMPVKGLNVTLQFDAPRKVTLASGRPVQTKQENGHLVCTFDLDVADALILRR